MKKIVFHEIIKMNSYMRIDNLQDREKCQSCGSIYFSSSAIVTSTGEEIRQDDGSNMCFVCSDKLEKIS